MVLVRMVSIIGVDACPALLGTGDEGWSDFSEMLDWCRSTSAAARSSRSKMPGKV
jgi:hypothetical protein